MSRSTRSLEDAAPWAGIHRDAQTARAVDLVDGWCEDDVNVVALAHLDVGFQGARVAVKVLTRTELRGVDEVGHDDAPLRQASARFAHELSVALVKGAHRHHHCHGHTADRRLVELRARARDPGHRPSPDRTARSESASDSLSVPAARARSTVARASARYVRSTSGSGISPMCARTVA